MIVIAKTASKIGIETSNVFFIQPKLKIIRDSLAKGYEINEFKAPKHG